jgi:hypothetical protein
MSDEFDRKVEAPVRVTSGTHTGTIVDVKLRTTSQNYKYVDFIVTVDGTEAQLKVSFPDYLSSESSLGEFLTKFGKINVGEVINYKALTNLKKISFDVVNEPGTGKNEGKTYSNISANTIKAF